MKKATTISPYYQGTSQWVNITKTASCSDRSYDIYRICAREECKRKFEPSSEQQMYCLPSCRTKANSKRKLEKKG